MEMTWLVISGERMGKKVQGIRSMNGRYKVDREVKNGIGNGDVKELICMIHGHEVRVGNAGGRGAVQGRGE